MEEQVVNLLIYFATQIPKLCVWLFGGIFALVTWRRHRGASALVLLAFLILAVAEIVSDTLHFLGPPMIMDAVERGDMSAEQMSQVIMWSHRLVSTGYALAAALAYLLLVIAAFAWRAPGDRIRAT